MTEAEWLACTDPTPMLEFLRGKASDRKLRLFAVPCCRRIRSLFFDVRSRSALEFLERYLDDRAIVREFCNLLDEVLPNIGGECASQALVMEVPAWWIITLHLLEAKLEIVSKLVSELTWKGRIGESIVQAFFLREILGNPFRPILVDQSWLTAKVVELAQEIYAERAFNRLLFLADALKDGGCTDTEILAHCRQGLHIRGCWVLDLVMGKG